MKVNEILSEALMHPGIKKELLSKGYKFVGKGQDQDVYIEPGTGLVLKIFGTESGSKGRYTRGQQSFIDFYDYCRKHPENPHLPQIFDFAQFEYPKGSGKYYLQIRMERLFPFNKSQDLADALENLASYIQYNGGKGLQKYLTVDYQYIEDTREYLIMHLGKEGLKQMAKAMMDLNKIAKSKNYTFDLHEGNFLVGSDGELVISDPFFTGTWRGSAGSKKSFTSSDNSTYIPLSDRTNT